MDLIEREQPQEEEKIQIPTEEELKDFRSLVNEWIKMDEQIRKLSIALRERKVHLKALSENMQRFMSKFGYDNLNTNQGRILNSVRKVKEPIKMIEIKEFLLEKKHFTGEQLFKELFEKERPVKQTNTIRRIVPKVSMHLDI
jgi:hypothetical protein